MEQHVGSMHLSQLYAGYREKERSVADLKNAIQETHVLLQALGTPVAQLCSLISDESVHARITQLYDGLRTAHLTDTAQSIVGAVNARLSHVLSPDKPHDVNFIVHIKAQNGGLYFVQLPSPHCTVFFLKLKLQEQQGLSPEQVRFIVAGRDLDDSEILSQSGVTAQSQLQMVLKPNGDQLSPTQRGQNGVRAMSPRRPRMQSLMNSNSGVPIISSCSVDD